MLLYFSSVIKFGQKGQLRFCVGQTISRIFCIILYLLVIRMIMICCGQFKVTVVFQILRLLHGVCDQTMDNSIMLTASELDRIQTFSDEQPVIESQSELSSSLFGDQSEQSSKSHSAQSSPGQTSSNLLCQGSQGLLSKYELNRNYLICLSCSPLIYFYLSYAQGQNDHK